MNNHESKNDDMVYIVDADTGKKYEISQEIVHDYIEFICNKMKMTHLDINLVVKNVLPKLKKINTEQEFEDQIVMTATEMITEHYDYPNIATYLLISNLHKKTDDDYLEVVKKLRANVNKKGKPAPIVSKSFAKYVEKHHTEINAALNYELDYGIPIFGYRTLERAYLKKTVNGKIVERPQHMYMRVAIALHYRTHRLDKIIETYNLLSQGYFTHATPTLFNAGTKREQLSSCFLLGIDDDMLEIGECWKRCALISKYSGGIGIHMTNLRVNGAYIHSTQGMASGMRVTKVFNEIARYADQGGKRAGSIAIYIEPWHGDIFFFLELKKNTGAETDRARDLFLALMVNDIFMKRVEADGIWSLMCPHSCPDLLDKYGEEFTQIYEKYEREGNFLRQIPARELFFKIMESQIETGVPYIVYKDAVNYKSNQINIGVVNGSNLCVSGDTMILTSKGYYPIETLENQKVEVWNGHEFSETVVKKTGTNQKLLEIEFSNGTVLKCTPYHKFYITNGSRSKTIIKSANELEIGEKLIRSSYPIITNGYDNFKYPYTHGLFCANGTYEKSNNKPKQCNFKPMPGEKYCSRHIADRQIRDYKLISDKKKCHAMSYTDHPILILRGDRQELAAYLDFSDCGEFDTINDKVRLNLYHDLAKKYTVPINQNIKIKLNWLAGLLDGCGVVINNSDMISLQISSINKEFLNSIKYMLQTMGCDPKVTSSSKKETSLMPDGKGGMKIYAVKPIHRLLISSNDTYNLIKLGLETNHINLKNIVEPNNMGIYNRYVQVTKISALKEKEDTFCFNESLRHMGIFNGVITGQCSEIVQVSNTDEIAVCFTADTEIVTKNGIKKITECDGCEVLSYYDNDIDLNNKQHYEKAILVSNGVKKVYELKTSGNQIIKATNNHPFLVLENRNKNTKVNQYIWKELKDLEIGDRIMTPRIDTLEKFKISPADFDIEYLAAGWMIGDGWMTKTGWGVCFGPTEKYAQEKVICQMNKWQQSVEALEGGHNKNIKTYIQPNGVVNWQSQKENFKQLLKDKFGFEECKGPTKKINQKIKNSEPVNQAAFLSAYFSADGCVMLSKNKLSVALSSASEEILYDVQSMLIPFGISSKVRFGEVKTRPGYFQGTLAIHGQQNLFNFEKFIGFRLCPEKHNKLLEFMMECNRSYIKFSDASKVISIKAIGEENVYDLVLNESHNFIANGHVVHNCNLASICLPKFIEYNDVGPVYNYQKLYEVARVACRNLNNIIDINYYPVEQARISNLKHRPIGIGVQGLADVYAIFKTPFDSELARDMNRKIFETIYYGAMTESMTLAREQRPYETFKGSPFSKGKFQFDLWKLDYSRLSGMWDWEALREQIKIYGVRNSLTTTCMPTASTSQIQGWNECIESYTENIYTRSTLAGDFYVINRYLMKDLMDLGLWNEDTVDLIKYYEGSIQQIDGIPDKIKQVYRTAWEIPQRSIIEMSADRAPFIDQTQSLNIFIAKPDFRKLTSAHFTGWRLGLKTGMYYLRSKSSSEANQFGIDIDKINRIKAKKQQKQDTEEKIAVCPMRPSGWKPGDDCECCSG